LAQEADVFAKSRVVVALVALTAAAVAVGGAVLSGSAGTPDARPTTVVASSGVKPAASQLSTHPWKENQGKLAKVSDAMQQLLDPKESGYPVDPSGEESGFARFVIDPLKGRYTLYWKGQIPPEVTKILDGSELPGSIVPTEVSLPDLMRANRAAQKALAALGLPKAVRMASIMKNHDWSGVIAAVHDPDHLVSPGIVSRLPSRVGPATVEWVRSDGVGSGYETSGQ
jgi:hypothetical protein